MRWSVKIGTIFGIDFKIHVTFLLLLVFVYLSVANQKGAEAGLRSVLFICAIFACVLIHEVGHSLIARRYGKEAKSITLLPIGGVATMEEIPENPLQEIFIAAIGPFINLGIAGLLYLLVGGDVSLKFSAVELDSFQAFAGGLFSVNIMLALFNIIPAFPMDGGRVLRGLLAMKLDYGRATSLAVTIGQGFSLLFIFFGLFYNFWLVIIGIFLYIGAGSEQQHVMVNAVLKRVPATAVMVTAFQTLRPEEPLKNALEHVYHGCQEDFPVVGESGLEGILTRTGLIASVHEKGAGVPVSEVMDRDVVSVSPRASLDEVYRRLLAGQKTVAAVMENNTLKGLLCLDTISRYFMIQSALKGRRTA